MSLNVGDVGASDAAGAREHAGGSGAHAGSQASDAVAAPGEAGAPRSVARRSLIDEVLAELTNWSPRERAGAFRDWHRGSLSLVHLQVLTVLEADGQLSMSRLADALDVSVASATGIVDRMERRGLVERRHATGDRRVVDVRLTEGGVAVFGGFALQRQERLGTLLQELSDAELSGLLAGVRGLRAARRRLHDAGTGADMEPGGA